MKNISTLAISLFLVGCLSVEPTVRKPVSDVPFTYQIGWWPYQEYLEVTSLDTKVIDSRLNLFNSKSLISISFHGKMKNQDNGWKPFISSVHISEKVIKRGNFANSEAEIQVTPIIETKKDKSYSGENIEFTINQELILHSMGWGKNTFYVTSQNHEETIEVQQSK